MAVKRSGEMSARALLLAAAGLALCDRAAGFQAGAAWPLQGRRSARSGALALRAVGTGDPAGGRLARREAAQRAAAVAAGAWFAAGAQPAAAFCPPDCSFLPEDQKKTLKDVKVVAQEEKVVAASDSDGGPPIDLSILEQRQQARVTDKAYFDVTVGDDTTNTSRIVIGLFGEVVPETVKNFKALVTGEKGFGFQGTTFYRIVKDLQISGGDVLSNGGKTGKSAINGDVFPQENFRIMHTVPGVVSMQNTIDKQVDSRFFISTRQNVDLGYSKIFDGKYVAFGLVIEGMEVVERLNNLETKSGIFDKGIKSGRPKQEIIIQKCGFLGGDAAPLSTASPSGAKPVYSGAQLQK